MFGVLAETIEKKDSENLLQTKCPMKILEKRS